MISFNAFLILFLIIYSATSFADLVIERINIWYGKKNEGEIPNEFRDIIDRKELKRINEYTFDNTRFSIVHSIFSKALFLSILLSGLLPWLVQALSETHFILAGLIFFALPGILSSLLGLPFDYYHAFIIEERYGFNTQTIKIWLSDLLKSTILVALFGTILLSALLSMIRYFGQTWWIWAWAFFLGFQTIMLVLYPTVIAPLFNKFTLIEDPDLAGKIEDLAKKEGLSIKGIYRMDASKRSRHTNAYLTGLGRAKRIVLFDSLIESHEIDEILAVLAHEIAHLKRGHIKKQMALMAVFSLLLFFLASKLMLWEVIYESFGFSTMPPYAGLFLVGALWEPIGFLIAPLGHAVSRYFEKQADLDSLRTVGTRGPLLGAFKKMAKDNLANLRPHPLYVFFNYSHPTLLSRIRYIQSDRGLREGGTILEHS
ncbi:MAG: M48 family metallopeptidase [Desulfatiglans sp.]|jgi:STE24 endopeptidase|nr:M48 family metallopeptidase [Thermodesulfobacteriota bacterium]MEE4353052.1 M48 family metallopeptidase [Desulfatiglans sp.]